MMQFKKYMHIERYGNDEVQGIEFGISFIFPKIDGTNGSVWLNDGSVNCGSRNRELTIDNDNAGFKEYIVSNVKYFEYLKAHPDHRLYGEWLVKHTLNTYRNDAWKKFYIFDVAKQIDDENEELLPYDIYQGLVSEFDLDYIPPICSIKNASYEQLIAQLEANDFLIKDGAGSGEGIVIKNYDYYNRFGRQTWAKIVRSEFREMNYKIMGAPAKEGKSMVEERIVSKYCTESLIEKTFAKIKNECDGWNSKLIPRLFSTVFYDLINEDAWNFIKEFKQPIINFKTLNHLVINHIKEVKKDLF